MIVGRALNPRLYGPSPDVQPDDYNYFDSYIFNLRSSTPKRVKEWTIEESDWYRVWCIGVGGGGGIGASGLSDSGGAGGGGGGHGGIGYFDLFMEAGNYIHVQLYKNNTIDIATVYTTQYPNGAAVVEYGERGKRGSGQFLVGDPGRTGQIRINAPINKIFTPAPATSGGSGDDVTDDGYGGDGGPGGNGGYMAGATKYSFAKNQQNITPPNLNLGNGNRGGNGGRRDASGEAATPDFYGGVIIERGVYN